MTEYSRGYQQVAGHQGASPPKGIYKCTYNWPRLSTVSGLFSYIIPSVAAGVYVHIPGQAHRGRLCLCPQTWREADT